MHDQFASALSVPSGVRAGAPEGAPHISGAFIRQALLGQITLPPDCPLKLDSFGARLEGAIVEGGLDLSALKFDRPLTFARCTFIGAVSLRDAATSSVYLMHCQLSFLDACNARIDGTFDLTGTRIENPRRLAVIATSIRVGTDLRLVDGFTAMGSVNLKGAAIGGSLDCGGGAFLHPIASLAGTALMEAANNALCCESVTVGTTVSLSQGFRAEGIVQFRNASIGTTFFIMGCSVSTGGGSSCGLLMIATHIGQALVMAQIESFKGLFNLRASFARRLADDGSLWRDLITHEARSDVMIELDDFRYDAFIPPPFATSNLDWRSRLLWLKRQPEEYWSTDFRSQPFTQCAEVLRNMGDAHGSRMILFERERLRLKAKHVGFWDKVGGHILGVLAGYGYKTHFALYWAVGIWLLGGLIFGVADYLGEMRPADPHILVEREYQETLRPTTDYEPVDPLLYSADILLPIVELGQQEYWIPRNAGEHIADVDHAFPNLAQPLRDGIAWLFGGWLPKAYYYFEIFMGWLLVSIVIAGFSGLLGHAKEE